MVDKVRKAIHREAELARRFLKWWLKFNVKGIDYAEK